MTSHEPNEHPENLYEGLRDPRRRAVWTYLHTTERSVFTVDELADEVLRRDASEERTDDRRRQAALGLHHVHLPKLEESGLLEYDARDRLIRYRGREDATGLTAESVVERVEGSNHDWSAGSHSSRPSVDR